MDDICGARNPNVGWTTDWSAADSFFFPFHSLYPPIVSWCDIMCQSFIQSGAGTTESISGSHEIQSDDDVRCKTNGWCISWDPPVLIFLPILRDSNSDSDAHTPATKSETREKRGSDGRRGRKISGWYVRLFQPLLLIPSLTLHPSDPILSSHPNHPSIPFSSPASSYISEYYTTDYN